MRAWFAGARAIALAGGAFFAAACAGGATATFDADGGANADGAGPKPPCASCHMPDYLDVRHPVHVGVKPTECAVCHRQEAWKPSVLDHAWPLAGKHEKTECFACHSAKPPKFKGIGKECVDCHRKEYDKPPFADHMLFQLACAECHATTDWKTLVPHPIWPPEPAKEIDAGAADAAPEDVTPAAHDGGPTAVKPKPKPKPKPPIPQPPDVTTGGSRHIHR